MAVLQSVQGAQPNLVLILADDLGIGDTGTYGSTVIETPNIYALSRGGVRFTQGYVSHPVCSPSRAGLMTGRYQQRHGWEFNPAGRDVETGMDPGQRTLADVLGEAGYATDMVGKWHLGYGDRHHPLARGFERYFGVLAGGSLFIDPDEPGVESMFVRYRQRPWQFSVFRDREPVEVTDYLTDAFTDEAVASIQRRAAEDRPFFLYLAHTTPHTPLQATPRYLEAYRHIVDPATRIYAAMVASLDESVGRIVEALEAVGELDNTLIVFSSDNGCAGYIGAACSNAPFSGFKRYHQEGGIRVPLIMRWPERLPAGRVYDMPVILLDLLATFAAAADSDVVTEDSVNLLPYLTGESEGAPHTHLFWRSGPTIAIRGLRWKLIEYPLTGFTAADLGADGRLQPPEGGWPMEAPLGRIALLYDLIADPGEARNLAGEQPEVLAELRRHHEEWSRGLSDPILPAVRSTLAEADGQTVQLVF
jgi:arylsulfatase A-like enzyme